jgi:hypothetical protein
MVEATGLFYWFIDYVARLTAQITGLLFIPRVNVSAEPWWRCRLGITPDLSTRARWQSYQQRHLERVRGMDERMRILPIQYLWYVNGFLTCRKILRHGIWGFTSHPKEVVLRIFIALKNPSPRPGFNPRPLGPVASTLYHEATKVRDWKLWSWGHR